MYMELTLSINVKMGVTVPSGIYLITSSYYLLHKYDIICGRMDTIYNSVRTYVRTYLHSKVVTKVFIKVICIYYLFERRYFIIF